MTIYVGKLRTRMDTRLRILGLLKADGPSDARTLAARLRVSPMAVRHHLQTLRAENVISYREELRPLGRPAKMWRLREQADVHFPDAHAELSVGLLRAIRGELGERRLRGLLNALARERSDALLKRLRARASFATRLRAFVAEQVRQGFIPKARTWEDGSILLELNHCPIRTAAAECPELCEAEREFLRLLLGGDCEIRRMDHVLTGARNCVYRIHGPATKQA